MSLSFHFTIHNIVHRLLTYFLIRIVKMGGIWKVILFFVVDTIIKQLKKWSTHWMNVVIEWKFVPFHSLVNGIPFPQVSSCCYAIFISVM